MSYILDALRRADAERSRGAVPGLHAQGLPPDLEPAARDYRPLIWAAGGAGALLVAVIVILVVAPWKSAPAPAESRTALASAPDLAPTPRDALAASAPAQMAQGELPAVQPGAIEPGARPVEPPIGRGNPPPTATADARAPQPYPPPPTARTGARDMPPDASTRPALAQAPAARTGARDGLDARAADGRVATLEPRSQARTPTPAAPAPVEHYGAPLPAATPPVARGNAVPNIKDLPPDVRAQLPKLTVAGSVYSDTPSARMVILNGQVVHEGDKPAADTVLEQIRLKSAILNFRGQRYEITF